MNRPCQFHEDHEATWRAWRTGPNTQEMTYFCDEAALDALRQLVPESEPGKVDLKIDRLTAD